MPTQGKTISLYVYPTSLLSRKVWASCLSSSISFFLSRASFCTPHSAVLALSLETFPCGTGKRAVTLSMAGANQETNVSLTVQTEKEI